MDWDSSGLPAGVTQVFHGPMESIASLDFRSLSNRSFDRIFLTRDVWSLAPTQHSGWQCVIYDSMFQCSARAGNSHLYVGLTLALSGTHTFRDPHRKVCWKSMWISDQKFWSRDVKSYVPFTLDVRIKKWYFVKTWENYSVQSLSRVWLSATPWTAALQTRW